MTGLDYQTEWVKNKDNIETGPSTNRDQSQFSLGSVLVRTQFSLVP